MPYPSDPVTGLSTYSTFANTLNLKHEIDNDVEEQQQLVCNRATVANCKVFTSLQNTHSVCLALEPQVQNLTRLLNNLTSLRPSCTPAAAPALTINTLAELPQIINELSAGTTALLNHSLPSSLHSLGLLELNTVWPNMFVINLITNRVPV